MAEQIELLKKKKVISLIRKFFPDVKIFAFGSRIRGDARKYSDLDIALKAKSTLNQTKLADLKEEFTNSDIPFKIDLLDFQNLSDEFKNIIYKTSVDWTPKLKTHPWRLCPPGQYWRRIHSRQVLKSKKNPDGKTEVDGHCVHNPSGKDQIYKDEIQRVADRYFSKLGGRVAKYKSTSKKINWNQYDHLIEGWTQYWNEIFKLKNALDPNFIKALIATESSFDVMAKPPGGGTARGLMQLKSDTVNILKNEKGELKDHYVNLTLDDRLNPNFAICAGIRWLFYKYERAKARLEREPTWREAIIEYKGYWRIINSGKKAKGMGFIDQELKELDVN